LHLNERNFNLTRITKLIKLNQTLVYLSLEDDGFINIPNISNYYNLKRLSLQNNELGPLKDAHFLPTSIVHLDLSHNLIDTVEKDFFTRFSNLLYVYLNDNRIKSLSLVFENMREIQVFSIANCQTESVYMEFKSEKNISTIVYDLDLSHNYLMQFPHITGRLVQISI
jgi:Leucine-rich repeat (LRR) protein